MSRRDVMRSSTHPTGLGSSPENPIDLTGEGEAGGRPQSPNKIRDFTKEAARQADERQTRRESSTPEKTPGEKLADASRDLWESLEINLGNQQERLESKQKRMEELGESLNSTIKYYDREHLLSPEKSRGASREQSLGSDNARATTSTQLDHLPSPLTIEPERTEHINEWLDGIKCNIAEDPRRLLNRAYRKVVIDGLVSIRKRNAEEFKYIYDRIQDKYSIDETWKPIKDIIDSCTPQE